VTEVRLSGTADRQLRALRGDRRKAALGVLNELEHLGCEAAGYRLAGEVLDHICCRHLRGEDRMLIMWTDEDATVVVSIARHDRGAADIYETVLDALELEVPEDERTKPPCCDDEGLPPVDEELADRVANALRDAARRR
jgi:hypothetical protein